MAIENNIIVLALLIGAIILAIAIYFFFRFMKSSDKKLKLLIDPKTKNSIVLIDRENLSEDSRKFRFGLPSVNHILGLPVGQHVKISTTLDGNIVSRSYTPVTSDDDHGFLEFIIKIYFANVHPKFPNGGKMTQYLECMKIGDMINISGPYGNLIYEGKGKFLIKETYGSPFVSRIYSKVGMIAGGTGIAPMLQIIRHVFKNPGDPLQIWLLYANRLEKDILMRQELENINNGYSDRFRLWYTLDQSSNNDWSYSVGYINDQMISEHLPSPGDDTLILMCGPPEMIKQALVPNLDKLGYSAKHRFIY